MGMTDTDVYGDYRTDNKQRNLFVTCIQICALAMAIVFIVVLCANTVKVGAQSFCDTLDELTPLSDGLRGIEFDNSAYQWEGVPSAIFESQSALILPAHDGGWYALFRGVGDEIIIAPLATLDQTNDANGEHWGVHSHCGYLLAWGR